MLKIPSFVKLCMMTCFDNPRVKVKILDILVGIGIAEKYTSEIMVIQFTMANTCAFDTHPCTKKFQ